MSGWVYCIYITYCLSFFFQAEDGIRDLYVTGVQTCALPISRYEALPRYPAVERDFSFLFPDSVVFEKIQQVVGALGLRELRSFVPVEIFRGGKVRSEERRVGKECRSRWWADGGRI